MVGDRYPDLYTSVILIGIRNRLWFLKESGSIWDSENDPDPFGILVGLYICDF